MKSWPVQDAKARFSELLAACAAQGPQMVTKRGVETAVLVPAAEWHRIQQRSRPTLKQLLLSDRERGDLAIHARRTEEHTSELMSLMHISYAGLCLNTKKN